MNNYGFIDMLKTCPKEYSDAFLPPPITPFEYDPKKFIIGKNINGEHAVLNAKDAFRACIIARTGTGKTFLIRRGLDQAYRAKWKIAILPDAKNEYRSSMKPVQSKFRNKLPDGDFPRGLKMKIFRPLFFNKVDNGKIPKDNERVSLELKDLTTEEFQKLCNFDTLSDKQRVDFDSLIRLMSENDVNDVEQIKAICTENNFTKLWQRLEFLETCGLFDSRFRVNPVDVLNEGNVLVLNYEKFGQLDLRNNSMDQIFLAVWLRWITDAKKAGKLDDLLIINDETARWVPNNGNPVCKKIILESVDVDRAGGISWWFGIQRTDSVPKSLLQQCKYKFLPYNVKRELFISTMQEEMIITDMVRNKKKAMRLYDKLQKKFRWLMIDGDGVKENKLVFMDVYPPTSAHMETKSAF